MTVEILLGMLPLRKFITLTEKKSFFFNFPAFNIPLSLHLTQVQNISSVLFL